jgi:hypothetical protein
VVGALIQLGNCFDLMDTKYTEGLREAYRVFTRTQRAAQEPLPRNRGKTPDKKLRLRDCAFLNFYLTALEEAGEDYDAVRCAFTEGKPAFPGSAIRQESHIQIAVRNPACILGVFSPTII